jgi:hypothetical protein
MPVCVTGMHRSGTSMITGVLVRSGLHVGGDDDLMAATPDNPNGYYEHRGFVALNERLFALGGGRWDQPPDLADGWLDRPEVGAVMVEAAALSADMGPEPWGWKDPRNSITLPFWLAVHPDLRVVHCVRHPLEVARSLERRYGMARSDALALWEEHNRTVVSTVPGERLLVTSYERWFAGFDSELERAVEFVGVGAGGVDRDAVASIVRGDLRHHVRSGDDLEALPPTVADLWEELSRLAEIGAGPADPLVQIRRELSSLWPAMSSRDADLRDLQRRVDFLHERVTQLHDLVVDALRAPPEPPEQGRTAAE